MIGAWLVSRVIVALVPGYESVLRPAFWPPAFVIAASPADQ
ncbi:hypothetical protein [Mycolicibacterium mageritense]|nr:hypothetical protein [Mycolicibacterium mageritense]